jgi:hypothetical protein
MRGIAVVVAAGMMAAGLFCVPAAAVAQASSGGTSVSRVMPGVVKYKFKNCTALNKVYPHGVGKSKATDKTSGKPVTTFKRSTSLYNKIVNDRGSHDRDHDGIACEKA